MPDVKFAKTKFVLHTGLALGAFRRYIYKPWKAGKLKKGADGRVVALAKAAAAGAFTAHELGSARDAALSDDRLRGLGDRLTTLTDNVKGTRSGARRRQREQPRPDRQALRRAGQHHRARERGRRERQGAERPEPAGRLTALSAAARSCRPRAR